jgi:hypothetical protein
VGVSYVLCVCGYSLAFGMWGRYVCVMLYVGVILCLSLLIYSLHVTVSINMRRGNHKYLI